MVLAVTVTKKPITRILPKLWAMTINMTLTDDGVSVINKDYAEHYRETDAIGAMAPPFVAQMQADIDEYIETESIYSNMQIAILVGKITVALESALET